DGRDVELLGNDAQVAAQHEANALGHGRRLRKVVQHAVERLGALAHGLVEQVLLRVDVRVERALLDAHRLGQVADRRAVVALLGEQARGLTGELGAPRRAHAGYRRKTSAAASWKL